MMEAAVAKWYSIKYMFVNSDKPMVTTFMESVLVITKGQKNSFHVQRNLIMPKAARAGDVP